MRKETHRLGVETTFRDPGTGKTRKVIMPDFERARAEAQRRENSNKEKLASAFERDKARQSFLRSVSQDKRDGLQVSADKLRICEKHLEDIAREVFGGAAPESQVQECATKLGLGAVYAEAKSIRAAERLRQGPFIGDLHPWVNEVTRSISRKSPTKMRLKTGEEVQGICKTNLLEKEEKSLRFYRAFTIQDKTGNIREIKYADIQEVLYR